MKIIIPVLLSVSLLSGCTGKNSSKNVSVNMDEYVKASELAIFMIYFQAQDNETNEPIDVLIDGPKPLIEPKMNDGVYSSSPILIESLGQGIYKVTWLDLKDSKATISVSSSGYIKSDLPLNYRQKIDFSQSSSGEEPYSIYKMNKKAQQAAPSNR